MAYRSGGTRTIELIGDITLEPHGELSVRAFIQCSGYSDPGCITAAPENCYPPESECEITGEGLITEATSLDTAEPVLLTDEEEKTALALLCEKYASEIETKFFEALSEPDDDFTEPDDY